MSHSYKAVESPVNIRLLSWLLSALQKYHDHQLSGKYNKFRECHIQPNWLLIYHIDGDALVLTASRTGTHSDLFENEQYC